jgi:hypothetical protein
MEMNGAAMYELVRVSRDFLVRLLEHPLGEVIELVIFGLHQEHTRAQFLRYVHMSSLYMISL